MSDLKPSPHTYLVAGGDLIVEIPGKLGWLASRTLAVDQRGVMWFKESLDHRWRVAGEIDIRHAQGETLQARFKAA